MNVRNQAIVKPRITVEGIFIRLTGKMRLYERIIDTLTKVTAMRYNVMFAKTIYNIVSH